MTQRHQNLVFVIVVLAAVGIFAGCSHPAAHNRGYPPVSVFASTTGRFAKGYSWHLTVTAERKAYLTIDTYSQKHTRIEISTNQINELVDAIETERFFDLRSDYGERVADGSTDRITIVRGGVSHTVRIHFLMNWVHSDPARLREPARAVRVFQVVRGWFDDKDAVNLKRYYDMVLEAACKGG